MATNIIPFPRLPANDNADDIPPRPITPALRSQIAATIEYLVGILDASDGDCDLEDGDPSGDPLDIGELDEGACLLLPIYGVDQTQGPLNERSALRDYYERQIAR